MVKLGEIHPSVIQRVYNLIQEEGSTIEEFESYNWEDLSNLKRNHRIMSQDSHNVPAAGRSIFFSIYEKVNLNLFYGDYLVPSGLAIIILFTLYKRVKSDQLFLLAALLFNINPLFVALLYIFYRYRSSAKNRPKYAPLDPTCGDYSAYSPQVCSQAAARQPADGFHHIFIGGDISTLYTAALLSRIGRKCCVLQPVGGPNISVSLNLPHFPPHHLSHIDTPRRDGSCNLIKSSFHWTSYKTSCILYQPPRFYAFSN
jgi:hypothetical protein